MNDLFLTYTLLTSVFILSGVLIIMIQYLLNVIKQKDLLRKDMDSHSQHILDEAREKAQEIIRAANEKAQEIINQTEIFSRETSDSSNQILATLRKSQKEELEKIHAQLLEEYVNLFKNISKDIQEKAGSEIKDFKDILERETLESQKIVGEKIESQYREVQEEIQKYRESEILKVRDNIYKIMQAAIMLAVGRSLDREIHEDLVMSALGEAIQEGELKQE